MKKSFVFLILILMTIFPVVVKANVVCNDGWVSSCVVSGPGCCSWHGGVAHSYNYSDNEDDYEYSEDYVEDDYEYSDDDDYDESSDDYNEDDYESSNENNYIGIMIFIIIIGFGVVASFCT